MAPTLPAAGPSSRAGRRARPGRRAVCTTLAGFITIFPVQPVRRFYALELPRGYLDVTLLIGVLGIAVLAAFAAGLRLRTPA
jgi:hypothetical protein